MMHDQEKSDLSTVAVKSANKGGQPSAESMERREGAEGNAGENRTRRTPSRESVFQGLDRTAGSKGKEEGKVHCSASPHGHRTAWSSVFLAETGCSAGHIPPSGFFVRGRGAGKAPKDHTRDHTKEKAHTRSLVSA